MKEELFRHVCYDRRVIYKYQLSEKGYLEMYVMRDKLFRNICYERRVVHKYLL